MISKTKQFKNQIVYLSYEYLFFLEQIFYKQLNGENCHLKNVLDLLKRKKKILEFGIQKLA